VVLSPNQGENFEILLNHCKKAITSVDRKSEKKVSFYDPSLENEYDRQIKIELSLENALQNKEFTAYYQPIVDITREDIRGFEALARWIHPKLGVVSPGEFIPILEKTHKIHRLDMFIIEKSIQETQIISKKFNKNFIVSCNVSVETILRPNFIEFILESLAKFGYPAKYLELEITESTIIYDFEKIRGIMSKLTSKGVRFSEDDFGDGYSSLNYLTQLDIQTLKISRTFTRNVFKNEKNKYFIETILNLAKSIGLETVIEGVEDLETLNFYKSIQCDYIQGFYFYKPMPFDKLLEIINEKEIKK